jgi:hypothetical protein
MDSFVQTLKQRTKGAPVAEENRKLSQGCIQLQLSSQTYILVPRFQLLSDEAAEKLVKGRTPFIRGIPRVSHCITSRLMCAGMKPATP